MGVGLSLYVSCASGALTRQAWEALLYQVDVLCGLPLGVWAP